MIGRTYIQVDVDEDKVVWVGFPGQRARITRRAAHPEHPQVVERPRSADRREVERQGGYAERPKWPRPRQNVCRNVPVPDTGESCCLHKRGCEGDYPFVKSEISLEANVIKAGVYVRGEHRLNDNGVDGD